ncbi:MAG: hypothetical protein P8020_11385 [Acidobacteriota bacterium]
MVRHQFPVIIPILLAASALLLSRSAYGYQHFKVAVYARAYEVREMADPAWLESHWDALSRQVHVDKIYLETHRDLIRFGRSRRSANSPIRERE